MTMHALVLDGFKSDDSRKEQLRRVLVAEIEKKKMTYKWVELDGLNIAPCRGCFSCWVQTPGICVIEDDAIEVARMTAQCDLLVYVTSVVFGGVSPILKSALDRNICLVHPFFEKVNGETHHKKRYKHYPPMVAVGVLNEDDTDGRALFARLLSRMSINHRSQGHSSLTVPESLLIDPDNEKSEVLHRDLFVLLDSVVVMKK
ncbi:flavodoxin family protein [Candidatus Thorarchaeota archaeon]|nr:MAG: flavodoxin family protein [Candidatus Thorarchaeota archaeon]